MDKRPAAEPKQFPNENMISRNAFLEELKRRRTGPAALTNGSALEPSDGLGHTTGQEPLEAERDGEGGQRDDQDDDGDLVGSPSGG